MRHAAVFVFLAMILAPLPLSRAAEQDRRGFWSFRPLTQGGPPAVKDARWVRTPVDAFIRAKQEERGLAPTGEASGARLVRRLCFDLTGLPPTPAELQAATPDPSADWYDRLVDKFLASPRYGERWGRHWLDLARF